MTGLIANGNSNNENVVISSGSFFPCISSKAIREALRFDSSVTNQRLIHAIENAIIEVNERLESLTSKAASLAELSTKTITTDGVEKPVTEVLYFRAVASAVGAEITEKYRAYDTNNNGGQKADDLTPTVDDYHRELRFAIRDLKKIRRLNVELI
ncbi:head completion/stabilization protein [Acinetobacter thermotolerans]|uniref:head completion/stabilization protein n=1 Tax=Acinetobacter thermotolerans TaxID=3151487 RepID=UPI00325BD686